jgi:hypothetical protein
MDMQNTSTELVVSSKNNNMSNFDAQEDVGQGARRWRAECAPSAKREQQHKIRENQVIVVNR